VSDPKEGLTALNHREDLGWRNPQQISLGQELAMQPLTTCGAVPEVSPLWRRIALFG
jgi:hypothetical protein